MIPLWCSRALITAVHHSGDSNLVVELLTAERGRLSAVAQGARRSQRRFGGGLGPLTLVDAEVHPPSRGELYRLAAATTEERFAGLHTDPVALGRAAYTAELCVGLHGGDTGGEPSARHALAWSVLTRLADRSTPVGPALLRFVEVRLLCEGGDLPPPNQCCACGADLQDQSVAWSEAEPGHLWCESCAPGHGRPAPEPVRALLLGLGGADLAWACAAPVSAEVSASVGRWLRPLIHAALGHAPRSARFLAQVQRGGLDGGTAQIP